MATNTKLGDVGCSEIRRPILSNAHVRLESIRVTGLSRTRTPETLSPEFQVLFPLEGVFFWHFGSRQALLDANQILFVSAGDVSQDSHPEIGDVDCLVLTPGAGLLEAAWACSIEGLAVQQAFERRVMTSEPRLQQAAAALAQCPLASTDPLVIEEAVIDLLAVAANHAGARSGRRTRASKLTAAVKEIIASCDDRISLLEIGERLGVSPTYLTDAFRRSEGLPISQYHRRLRLARALIELPHTNDITALALRFGFSSHAHFSTAFRAVFGQTPSEYRARANQSDFRSLLRRAIN
ncbi:MAG: helix-turn-helix transcriptional regulator [Gammaproteobacteria bacterium]